MLLNFGFGIGLALFNSIVTLIDQIVKACGYSEHDAGMFGAMIIGFGLLGAFIIGVIMDRTHAYNTLLKVCQVLSLISALFLLIARRRNNYPMLACAFGFLGLAVMPMLPIAMECGVECTYPVSEESSTGLLMNSGNVPSIALALFWVDSRRPEEL